MTMLDCKNIWHMKNETNTTMQCKKTKQLKRVTLTGRNTTGPPSRAAPWWVTLHIHRRGVLKATTNDDRRQTA